MQSLNASTAPKRRGRPARNGVRDIGVLIRGATAMYYFQQAREQGIKYEVAVPEAVATVRKEWKGARFSVTEFKRFLAEFCPASANLEMRITKEGGTYGVGFRPKQVYPKPRSAN